MGENVITIEWEQKPQRTRWKRRPRFSETRITNSDGSEVIWQATVPATTPVVTWEYLDHTADVQIHAWGDTISDAFSGAVVGMFGYMTELQEIDGFLEMQIEVEAHDWESLLFTFMDECLYAFHSESFVMKEVSIVDFDTTNFKICAVGRGGLFDVSRHSQGTEIKAITYSNMQIKHDEPGRAEVFVIVDI